MVLSLIGCSSAHLTLFPALIWEPSHPNIDWPPPFLTPGSPTSPVACLHPHFTSVPSLPQGSALWFGHAYLPYFSGFSGYLITVTSNPDNGLAGQVVLVHIYNLSLREEKSVLAGAHSVVSGPGFEPWSIPLQACSL